MLIKVNGQDKEVPEGSNILSLLDAFKLTPDKVAVELNRRLVKTALYGNALESGDQVEIVTFVGGG
ncbi:MAG: sulfur carrier protein ThiS [Planctomycetota bacterium]|nr:sulfur carrier protein ThiS [Planctomycetota bacterium]